MKSTFFIILIFTCGWLNAQQNLIPNPSFEEFTSCPVFGENGQGEFMKCKDWWYPTFSNVGTPDYMNECNNYDPNYPGNVGVPNNWLGNQEAFDGVAYIAITPSVYYLSQNYSSSYSEIVSTKLISKLKQCTNYKFTMRVSLCENASHGSSKLQFFVSKDSLMFKNINSVHKIDPTWKNSELISDTINWQLLVAEFNVLGGEQYLYIGNFLKLDTSDYVFNSDYYADQEAYVPYYYIDSVSLIEVGEVENCEVVLPNIFTPNYDGDNDQLNISYYNLDQLFIYNRWGNLIVELNEAHPIWDGTYQGKDCSEGIYYYVGEYKNKPLKGTIQLVR